MKLDEVQLNYEIKLGGRLVTRILAQEHGGPLELDDHPAGIIRLPDGRLVPLSAARFMIPSVPPLTCEECAALKIEARFETAQGLAAHRASKHGVPGASRQTEARGA